MASPPACLPVGPIGQRTSSHYSRNGRVADTSRKILIRKLRRRVAIGRGMSIRLVIPRILSHGYIRSPQVQHQQPWPSGGRHAQGRSSGQQARGRTLAIADRKAWQRLESKPKVPAFVDLRTVLGNPKCNVSAHTRHLVSHKSTDSAPLPSRTMTNSSDRSDTKYSTPSPLFDPNQFDAHPSGK
jgi:hypothetical protein